MTEEEIRKRISELKAKRQYSDSLGFTEEDREIHDLQKLLPWEQTIKSKPIVGKVSQEAMAMIMQISAINKQKRIKNHGPKNT